MRNIDTATAQAMLARGALLVDIRDPDEYGRGHIPGSRCIPLAALSGAPQLGQGEGPVVFHCRSGMRTAANAALLQAAAGGRDACVLAGGLDAWRRAGLPVVRDAGAPLELNRQVQITVGALVLAGTVLAAVVSPWFLLLTGALGAGLVVAGITGFCGMARVLAAMPWNRVQGAGGALAPARDRPTL